MLAKISFEKAKFWIDSRGILICKHFNSDINWKLNEKEAEKYILAVLTLAGDEVRPIIFDFRDVRGTYTILAARLVAKDPTLKKIIISEAFVVNSMAVRLLINAFKRIYEPMIPYKIFSNIKDAQEYSLNQLELSKEPNKKKISTILNPQAHYDF
jgi:capsule polysaccharide modification protein KpsS